MNIFSKFDWNFRRQIELNILREYVGDVKGQRILDVACGSGDITNEFSKNFKETYGVDYSKDAISEGKKKYPHIKFSVQDAHLLKFVDNYFDVVITNCSIEHFKDGKKALKEMQRVLKKGGALALTTETKPENINEKWNDMRAKYNSINQFYTVELLQSCVPKMKIERGEYYLSGPGMYLYIVLQDIGAFVTASRMALLFYLVNPAPGGFLHKLLFPLLCAIGSIKSRTHKNAMGVSIKAVK